jgi:HPt (histidine-containing phosphotransfer) domain-containing protein
VIGRAIGRGDLGAVAREAHRIKGSCLAVGEEDPARVAADLEARARGGDAEESARLAVELELALADAGARLEVA